jgi:uncharacterized membrane protein YdjX (TVP38/TMEM64 family)
MKRLLLLAGGLVATFLGIFALAHLTGLTMLVDAAACRQFLLAHGRWWAGLLGVGLLVVDVFLPVVSSVIMVVLGRLFGVTGGGMLALAGSLGAAWLGYAVGRAGGPRVARLIPPAEHDRVTGWLRRWGLLVVILSRPVPVLAETVAVLAGATRLGFAQLTFGALVGMAPPAFLYAWAGAYTEDWATGLWVFAGVVGLAGFCWWIGRRVR